MRSFIFLVLIALLDVSCKTSSTPNQNLDKKILDAVGSGFTISKNQSNTFALCTKPSAVSLQYKIVRLSDLKVVIDESIPKGSVVWNGDMKIIIESTPGMVRTDEPIHNTKIIDLTRFVSYEN